MKYKLKKGELIKLMQRLGFEVVQETTCEIIFLHYDDYYLEIEKKRRYDLICDVIEELIRVIFDRGREYEQAYK